MALDRNSNKWLGSKENKEAEKEKLTIYAQKVGKKVKHFYPMGSFCSGFAHDCIVLQTQNNEIYAIDPNKNIFKNVNNKWEVVK